LVANFDFIDVWVANSTSDSVFEISTETQKVVLTLNNMSELDGPGAVALSPDGGDLWVANNVGHTTTEFNITTSELVGQEVGAEVVIVAERDVSSEIFRLFRRIGVLGS
jgi:DNA-binding beta-propeller fold protein YncE